MEQTVNIEPSVCTLGEAPPGSLLLYDGELILKTEYRDDKGAVEAYIVGSGERFWGGVHGSTVNSLPVTIPRKVDIFK
jgi:hypothetical protein